MCRANWMRRRLSAEPFDSYASEATTGLHNRDKKMPPAATVARRHTAYLLGNTRAWIQ